MRPVLPVIAVTAGIAILAACVPQAPRTAAPVPPPPAAQPAPPPPPPRVADWRDLPQTPGTWSYTRDARGSLALFGPAGSNALVSLRCDLAARRLYLSRAGTATAPLTIRTSSTARAFNVAPTGGTPPYVAVALAPNDTILEAMGFSRGRFVIEQPGSATLAIPAWAEIERVTQDCRN